MAEARCALGKPLCVEHALPGCIALADVLDARGRPQGTAAFGIVKAASPAATAAAAAAAFEICGNFLGSSDPYYSWWANKESSRGTKPMTLQVNGADCSGGILLNAVEVSKLPSHSLFTGWSSQAMKGMHSRLQTQLQSWRLAGVGEPTEATRPAEDPEGLAALAAALGMSESEQQISKEELLQRVREASTKIKQYEQSEKYPPHQGIGGPLAAEMVRLVSEMSAGAVLAKRPRTQPGRWQHGEKIDLEAEEPSTESMQHLTEEERTHKMHPGRLFSMALVGMREECSHIVGLPADTSQMLPPTATTYMQTVLPTRPRIDMSNVRSKQEMATIMCAVDHLARGCPLQAADVLVQRAKALETSMTGGKEAWKTATHMELVSTERSGLVPLHELRSAQKQEQWVAQIHQRREWGSNSSSSGSKQQQTYPQQQQQQQQQYPDTPGTWYNNKGGKRKNR